ncbi:MAG: DNA polymerase III subunit delta' [Pelovirga sp.]
MTRRQPLTAFNKSFGALMPFSAIIGHTQQLELLRNCIASRRVAHAYLFAGPEGVGKRRIALAFAGGLLCETGTGCGTCGACVKVAAATHPDLLLVNADGATIKIEQVRSLQQQLVLRSFSGTYKICIIDKAERLTPEAANALLKTLEEPQPGTLLILVSSQPERLLPTIRSRCQQLPFARLPRTTLSAHLSTTLQLDPAAATVLAALSDGSLSRALGEKQELYLKKRPQWIQSLSALSAASTLQTFAFAEQLRAEKDTLDDLLDIFSLFYRDLLLYQTGAASADLVNQDLLPLIKEQSARLTRARLLKKIDAVTTARGHLARNVNSHLAMDFMLMQITHA